MRKKIDLILSVFLLFGIPFALGQPATYYPAPLPFKHLILPSNTQCLEVGQEFLVSIEVHGDSRIMDVPIPMDVVFLIDQSGSMETNDPNHIRMTAVRNFINRMKEPVRGGRDAAAIIEYDTRARGLYPSTSDGVAPALTRDYDALIDALEAHADGCTNIEEAMRLGNETLIRYGSNPNKLAILLSDGCPTDAYCYADYGQIDSIVSVVVPVAILHKIRYYSVGLGQEICEFLLDDLIAQPTLGAFCLATSAAELPACFDRVFEAESYRMTTQDVVVEERLPEGFKYKATTLTASSGIVLTPEADQTFAEEGQIDVPMGHLLEGQQESFSFVAYCEECVEPVMPGETVSDADLLVTLPVDAEQARVRYLLGDGVVRYMPLPNKEVCVERPGGPTIHKLFDPIRKEITIRIKSNYLRDHPEQIIKDLQVWEIFSPMFEACRESFTIAPDEIWGTGLVDPWGFYYHWTVGDLAPQQEWSVSVKLRCGACKPMQQNPLGIDSEKPRAFVKMVLPGTATPVEFPIPQALIPVDYPLIECPDPAGVPNFGIQPAQMIGEQVEFREESGAIWIDNNQNEFVEDWGDPAQVAARIRHVRALSPTRVTPILSGDPLAINRENRIYVTYRHTGGKPAADVELVLEARPKFSGLGWEQANWIRVANQRLSPDEAIEFRRLIDPNVHYVVLNWIPTMTQLSTALPSGFVPPSLILEALRLRVLMRTPGEILLNDNAAEELIDDLVNP